MPRKPPDVGRYPRRRRSSQGRRSAPGKGVPRGATGGLRGPSRRAAAVDRRRRARRDRSGRAPDPRRRAPRARSAAGACADGPGDSAVRGRRRAGSRAARSQSPAPGAGPALARGRDRDRQLRVGLACPATARRPICSGKSVRQIASSQSSRSRRWYARQRPRRRRRLDQAVGDHRDPPVAVGIELPELGPTSRRAPRPLRSAARERRSARRSAA